MSKREKVEFIAQVRRTGRGYGSSMITIPKAAALYLDLKPHDFVRVVIKKLEVEAEEEEEK